MTTQLEFLRQSIRTIADYPKPGIQFRDITTLLRDAAAFAMTVDALIEPWRDQKIDKVAGIEARGFILGGAVAHGLKCGFVPIRKRGKLPHETVRVAYSLEYGVDEMEMHTDAIRAGERVLLLDDLIATGGTATGGRVAAAVGRRARCARPVSSSICRGSAAPRACAPPAFRCNRCSRSEPCDESAHLRADCRRVAWRLVLAEDSPAARSAGTPGA